MIASLVVGVFVSLGFVVWQWKGTSIPLVPSKHKALRNPHLLLQEAYSSPVHIFKIRLVNGAMLTMFINGWNFLVQVYYIPSFYQLIYGYSAVKAGSLLLPITLMQSKNVRVLRSGSLTPWYSSYEHALRLSRSLDGKIPSKYTLRRGTQKTSADMFRQESILAGWIAWAVGLGLFSTLDSSSGLGKQIGYALLTGFGVGQTLQPYVSVIFSDRLKKAYTNHPSRSLIAVQAGVERKNMAVVTSVRK